MAWPEWLRKIMAGNFSDMKKAFGFPGKLEYKLSQIVPTPSALKGARIGYLGDILWFHHQGLLDLLVLSSTFYAEYLSKKGIKSILVPRGYHESYGLVRDQRRDIAAV